MSELQVVNNSDKPLTRDTLSKEFHQLGLEQGSTVIIHSSLKSLGWVCGGAIAVIQSLMDVVTESGNIVMPTHTSGYSEPSYWEAPPVPESWWEIIRNEMPAFDPKITPTRYAIYVLGWGSCRCA